MKSLLLLLAVFIAFASCEDSSGKKEGTIALQEDTTRYGVTPYNFPKLTPKAEALVQDWPIFRDFQRVSYNIQNIPIADIRPRSNNLLGHTDSLIKNIPDTLYSPAIESRLMVIKTRLHLLFQESKKGKPSPENLELYISELRTSIDNFVTQINEKVEKDEVDLLHKDDEEKELAKQRKAMDSIYKLELEDQKKE